MTADIRTAALTHARTRDAHLELSGQHWTRVFVEGAVWGAGRVTPTREQIAKAIGDSVREDIGYDYYELKLVDGAMKVDGYIDLDKLSAALMALMQELASKEDE